MYKSGNTEKVVICFVDGVKMPEIAKALEDKYDVQLFIDEKDEDVLVIAKKK